MPANETKSRQPAPPVESAAWQRIIAGARRHFLAQGFRGVTMDDLAEELGMSKKTLYAHFNSKIALVEAVMRAKFAEVEGELGALEAGHKTDFASLLHAMLATVQRQTAEIQPPFLRDIRTEAPDLFRLVEEKRAELIERHFGKLFREGRRTGMIRKDIPTWLIIEIMLAATRALVNPQRLLELELTPKAAFTAIISVMLEGVMTERGRRRAS
jgi:AcrR family transcriptional regulator